MCAPGFSADPFVRGLGAIDVFELPSAEIKSKVGVKDE